MAVVDSNYRSSGFFFGSRGGEPMRMQTRLLFALIPSLILLIAVTGYITHRIANHYLSTALERTVRLQTMAMAHAVEERFKACKEDLLFLAQGRPDPEEMGEFLRRRASASGFIYRECAYISRDDKGHVAFLAHDGKMQRLTLDAFLEIRPNPLLLFESIKDLKPGEVWISSGETVEYPFPTDENPNNRIATNVFRMITPWANGNGRRGYALLSIDATDIRNILSLYNSEQSPIWAFARSNELRFAYLFTQDGWVLFQSEGFDSPGAPLSTFLARAEYSGTLGKPGQDSAFRPAAKHSDFWKMIAETREGRAGSARQDQSLINFDVVEQYLAYAPVSFHVGPGREKIVAGVAFVDRSRMTQVAGYKQIDVMLIVTLVTIFLASLGVFFFSRRLTRSLTRLASAVKGIRDSGNLEPVAIRPEGYETSLLLASINGMIETMKRQLSEIQQKDRQIEDVSLKERVLMDDLPGLMENLELNGASRIIGAGPLIERLRNEIAKAAEVDVDVLIMGETGTGKQLTAEEIHGRSARGGKPLISINCGALDENLLLDTLFGHVKGAFTEAKTDRKGAFLEAEGGTLFLDEIQVASPKVQQALLRVLETRKLKPLGSDKELGVNVRVIAATNIDLKAMIEKRRFREDLYFRLKIVNIHTPALREQRENIPLLALHYLREAERLAGRSDMNLSRGALEKLREYDWPGNVRELKNCVTRAVVMAESKVLQAGEIRLENESPLAEKTTTSEKSRESAPGKAVLAKAPAPAELDPALAELNQRQLAAYALIQSKGEVSRKDYEQMHGGLPSRTAVYDLQDLVKKGILQKTGRGPATRYVLARKEQPRSKRG